MPGGVRVCIVVCADRNIFPLLVGLLHSLGCLDRARYHVAVLDTGLGAPHVEYVRSLCDAIAPVRDDLLLPPAPAYRQRVDEAMPFWRAQVCRPFLRDYFPGFDQYVHIDADTWVQDGAFLDHAVEEMARGNAVIVPELDVAYPHAVTVKANHAYVQAKKSLMERTLGQPIADRGSAITYFNTGFFGLAADAPHWDMFREYLTRMLRTGYHHLMEQLAFNAALFHVGRYTALPAVCNWMCNMAPPVQAADGLWRSPVFPNPVIHLVHLSGTDKMERYRPYDMLFRRGAYLADVEGLIDG